MAHPLGDQPDRPGPLVIAHRGASIDRAEHTLAAYRLAIESGADGLECDVRLTRDGHLVCIHDRTVDRTSDGTGPVSARTLAQLGRLNAAAWHEGPGATGAILTLVDLLELVRATERPLRLLIETKHPTRYGPRVEQQLALALDRFGFTAPTPSASQAIVMSFAASALRRMQRLRPDGSTVLLMESMLGSRRTGGLPTGTSIAGPSVELLRRYPDYVGRAHELGHQVFVWTVDRPEDIRYVCELGVDALITNQPALAMDVMAG